MDKFPRSKPPLSIANWGDPDQWPLPSDREILGNWQDLGLNI